MIFDKLENSNNYSYGRHWERAFDFLKGLDSSSEERRYDLEDGMFAIVMSYPTRDSATAKLETHRKYIDIQVTITGAEGIEWFHRDELKVTEEYDKISDVEFYEYPKLSKCKVENYPGYFSALWPHDAHMPQLKVREIEEVKKVVVKVPVELLKK